MIHQQKYLNDNTIQVINARVCKQICIHFKQNRQLLSNTIISQSNCANYNITLIMNRNHKQQRFQPQAIPIPQQAALQIKRQIQYYFSMANLVTDKPIRRMIESNNRGWVKIKDLLKFNRLRSLVTSFFEQTASLGQIEQIIEMVLKDSTRVKVGKGQIKLKRHYNWARQFKRVLYIQGQGASKQRVIEILSNLNIHEEGVTIQSGNSWHFVEFNNFTQEQTKKLHEQIKFNYPVLKTLSIEQFKQYQNRFNQIFYPQQQQNIKSTFHVTPRQPLHYDQIEVNTFPKAPKQNIVNKSIDYERVFSKYIKSRNEKTPQAYEKHRAQKIAYKKQHKIRKQKQSAMEIQ